MATGETKHIKSSLDQIRFRFPEHDSLRGRKNYVDDCNDEIFLKASLQFLYSLLAERTALRMNDNDAPTSHRHQVSEDSGTSLEIGLQESQWIEEYRRQLQHMENFFSNSQIPRKKYMEKLNETAVYPNDVRNLKYCTDSYASPPVRPFSSPTYGEYDISDDIKGSNLPVEKLMPNTAKDCKNLGIRGSASYASIVRNAVSGLAKNCGRKRNCKMKTRPSSANTVQGSGRPPENVEISFGEPRNRSSPESKVQAKRKQRFASTILNLLKGGSRRTCCTSSIYTDLLEKDQTKRSPLDSRVTPNSIGRRSEDFVRDDEKNIRRNKLICTLRNVSKESRTSIKNGEGSFRRSTIGKFSTMHADILPPMKVPNDFSCGKAFSPRLNRPQQTETCNIKVQATPVNRAKCDLVHETPAAPKGPDIICDKPADQIENIGTAKMSQNDVDTFLKLAAEIRRIQMQRHPAGELQTEIPVEIRTTKALLHLRKTDQVSTAEFWEHRDLQSEIRSHRANATGFRIQADKFLEMLDGTLPEGIDYFPPHNNDNGSVCEMQEGNLVALNSVHEKSALQVLFRQIATDASIISDSIELESCGNNDKAIPQIAPKRQLSKISVCSYSSESLSASDHEFSDCRTKSTSSPRDEETEIIIEEENAGSAVTEKSSSSGLVTHRESEKSIFCLHPVPRKQIHNLEDEKLSDTMMAWWAPKINYSTTPSRRTSQLSAAYSVSVNNLLI